MSVCYEPGSTEWRPNRGDYGCEYATSLIRVIEAHNCVKGCTRSGTPTDRAEFGPGGCCEILARVLLPDVVPELDPRKEGPHCRARVDPATAGMDPLFGEAGA